MFDNYLSIVNLVKYVKIPRMMDFVKIQTNNFQVSFEMEWQSEPLRLSSELIFARSDKIVFQVIAALDRHLHSDLI